MRKEKKSKGQNRRKRLRRRRSLWTKKVKLVDREEMERGERKEGRRRGREEVHK